MSLPIILPYNPDWPRRFTLIASSIRSALGPTALRIDHIGSTSVPGLASKDRIDMQLTLASPDHFDAVKPKLETVGFNYRPGVEADHVPPWAAPRVEDWEKRYLSLREPFEVNLHVRFSGRPNQLYPILFRDYLRQHPDSAAAYAELKRRLAASLRPELDNYAEVKDPACDLIMVAARDWATTTNWHPGPSEA